MIQAKGEHIPMQQIDAAEAIARTTGVVNPVSVYRAFKEGRIKGHKEANGRIIFEFVSWERWIQAALMKHELAEKYREIRRESNSERNQVAVGA
jgi:hypothetical protein